jgi:glycosidase
MAENCLSINHKAALPYCYFDIYRNKIIVRIIASKNITGVSILYGDPYNFVKQYGIDIWQYHKKPLYQQFTGAAKNTWRLELELPPWRRLMYGFQAITEQEEYYFSPKGFMAYNPENISHYYNHFFYPYIHAVDAPREPQWVKNTIWYQIFPERFCNGNPALSPSKIADWDSDEPSHRNFFGGDLEGVRKKLPYLKELGINGIYFTPLFKAPSNHKYDTEDYFSIDEHFGELADLKQLVSDAHAMNIRVMLDAVFNHAGETHPFWQDILSNQEKSEYKDYFHIHSFPVKKSYKDIRRLNFDTFAFSSRMPKWNTENPHVRQYLIDAALYWIRECDIDAWRLDVANEVSFDFWREFSQKIHAAKDDFYILGEVWYDASKWIHPGYFDAVMNYPLGFAIIEYFLERKISADIFTEKLCTALTCYSDLHNEITFNLLDSHDTSRALTTAGGKKSALKNAFTMLFLLPGAPCIYYGTEIGMSGGADPLNRRPMIWDTIRQDQELFSFFQELIMLRRTYLSIINNAVLHYIHNSIVQGCWELTYGTAKLSILYTGEYPVKKERLEQEYGRLVFSTGSIAGEEILPCTIAVFECGLPPASITPLCDSPGT